MARDRAPIGNTCPQINSVIEVLAGVADRLRDISDKLDLATLEAEANDIFEQSGNLRALFKGRCSPLEELRTANEALRNWGNEEAQSVDEAREEIKRLESRVDELESF